MVGQAHPVGFGRWDGVEAVVGQHVGEGALVDVTDQGLEMVVGVVTVGLAFLGGNIAHIDLDRRPRGFHCLGDFFHQQVGDDAGVEAARPGHNHISFEDGMHGLGIGARRVWIEIDMVDASTGGDLGDQRFPAHPPQPASLVGHIGHQADQVEGRGQHPPAHGQDPAGLQQPLLERPRDPGHRRQVEVAKGVPIQPGAAGKTVLEELGDDGLGLRERRQVVAEVAGREQAQTRAQPAGAAAVIGDGDDGGEMVGVVLQPAQDGGHTGAAADADDAGAALPAPKAVEMGGHLAVADPKRRQQRSVERHQPPNGETKPDQPKQPRPQLARQELQGQIENPHRVDAGQINGAQQIGQPQAEKGDADDEDDQPAFDAQPRHQPGEVGAEAAQEGHEREAGNVRRHRWQVAELVPSLRSGQALSKTKDRRWQVVTDHDN